MASKPNDKKQDKTDEKNGNQSSVGEATMSDTPPPPVDSGESATGGTQGAPAQPPAAAPPAATVVVKTAQELETEARLLFESQEAARVAKAKPLVDAFQDAGGKLPADEFNGVPVVEVEVPKSFNLTLTHSQTVKIAAGARRLPQAWAEHWYSKAHGVKILQG